MKEIEIKILEINKIDLIKKLNLLNAQKIFEGEMISIFFSKKDFKNTLRLRSMNNKHFLTLKKDISKKMIKIRDEFEVEIKNFNNMKKIIENLGFYENLKVIKKRTSFIYNKTRIEIDEYKNDLNYIPTFIEIEGKNKKDIINTVKKLGYDENQIKPWTMNDLKRYYQK